MRRTLLLTIAALALVGAGAYALLATREDGPDVDVPRSAVRSEPAVAAPTPVPVLAGRIEDDAVPTRESASSAAGTGALRVVVTANGAPVAGASVGLGRGERTVTTDASGAAVVDGLAAGSTEVRVVARGLAVALANAEVEAERETVVELDLRPGISFEGRVLDAETDAPIGGATVAVHGRRSVFDRDRPLEVQPAGGRTSADGEFRASGAAEDDVVIVEAHAPGRTRESQTARIVQGRIESSPVAIRLARAARLVGTVRGPEGDPAAGAEVFVYREEDRSYFRRDPSTTLRFPDGRALEALRAAAGTDGSFVLDGLAFDRPYVVVAAKTGLRRSEEIDVVVPRAGPAERRVDFTLALTARVLLRLVDESGGPVEGEVSLLMGDVTTRQEVGPDGTVTIEDLEKTQSVEVVADGFTPTTVILAGVPGREVSRTVRLEGGASVSGVVVDEGGGPVADAWVSVAPAAANEESPENDWLHAERTARSAEDGSFTVEGLPAGDCIAIASLSTPNGRAALARTERRVRVHVPGSGLRLVVVRRATASLRLLAGGEPFVGEVVYSWSWPSGRSATKSAVQDGRVVYGDLPAGEIEFEVHAKGYAPVRRTATLAPREALDWGDVGLDPGATVTGRVVDGRGAPVAGARVGLDSHGFAASAEADAQGAFRLSGLLPEKTKIHVSASGFLTSATDLDVRAGMAPVEFVLRRGALVRARLVDERGEPRRENAWIHVSPADTPVGHVQENGSFENGRFEKRVPPGRWRFSLHLEGRNPPTPLGVFDLVEGETRDLEIPALPR